MIILTPKNDPDSLWYFKTIPEEDLPNWTALGWSRHAPDKKDPDGMLLISFVGKARKKPPTPTP